MDDNFDIPHVSGHEDYKSLTRLALWAVERSKIELSSKDESHIILTESEARLKDQSDNDIYIDINLERKQLDKLINELNFNKIHLVGFSLGALIARHFASEHSDKLSSLIIHGSIYKRTEEQKRVVRNRFEVAKIDKPASKQTALRRWLSADFSKKNPDIYKKIYSILDKNNRLDFLKCYEIFVNYVDDDSMLKKINVNTLITTGENDVGSTPEMSKNLSKMIQGSKFIEIKKGKHLCSIECADDVNITFKEFIDQHND